MIADLVALLQRYDDDAWVALANRGLLRRARKDLEAAGPSLVSMEPVVVQVGSHQVTFPQAGPAAATCSCPAATICHHVITAGLWLAGTGSALASEVAPPDMTKAGRPDVPARLELHDELMAFDAAVLTQHAGRAGLRWAAQFVADLEPESVRVEQGQHVLVGFRAPRVTFRYMGGGLRALVPDVKLPSPEKYAVAAVLAYQRAHGAAPPTTEPAGTRETAARRAKAEGRGRLLQAASDLLLDTVRLGASHLSPAVHQRYETLAVWAQGAEIHRLALSLRRLADHVELLLARNARADEHALLDEAAVAYALVCALAEAGEPAPRRLLGRARATYFSVPSMTLIGLGGTTWHAPSGYRGLTCLFWWIEEQRFVSWTDARPDSMWGFEPRARWTQSGPWTGLGSPSLTPGRLVRLTDAQLSPHGRLSGVERTHASVGPIVDPPWSAIPTYDDWSILEMPARSLLDESDPLLQWVVLRPASADPAIFDPIRQVVWWVLRDRSGAPLTLTLHWTMHAGHAVQRLESLTPEELPEGFLVVARLGTRGGQLTGEPLSLVRGNVVDALHFHDSAARKPGPLRSGPVAAPAGDDESAPVPLPGALVQLRSWTLQQLERGTGASESGAVLAALEQRQRAARDAGFPVFRTVEVGADPARALLRSHYVGLQVAALLG